ncbi:MAG: glycosyltransferase family 2 protein [Lachnospiraceae bacterium]|nr:glycosyltransferase family 2 protein [Lachnospiraceae bacterium]
MRATIIIPVYNVEKYLKRCLDSVLDQTIDDYEIICVNDCSPDGCQDILEEYENKYSSKMKVLENEENMGQGRSRMRAVEIAQGDYILFVDSDDYVARDYIETFLKYADYDMVIAGYTKDVEGKLVVHDVIESPWTLVCYPVACCKMYRKAFLLEHGIDFSEVRVGEDIYFTLALFCCNAKTKFIHYFGYYYYLNQQSTTQSLNYDGKHERYVSVMFGKILEKYPIDVLDTKKQQMVEYAYVANMVNALITYGHGCKPRLMREKYTFFREDLNEKFPNYRKNPYYRVIGMVGPNSKIKWGVSVTMHMIKIGLGWPMYWLISLI